VSERLIVRLERAHDHSAIRALVADAFGSAVEAELVERIRASPEYVPEMALVAELDGEIVGHVMISGAIVRNDGEDRPIVMLSPLAVSPNHERLGIGSALVRAVTRVADERGEPLVVLEGNPDYYSQFGFEHSVRFGLEMRLPDWAPSEAGQVLRLSGYDSNDASLRGLVVYPAAFDGLE
jgi:putative acetyltransferase